jgi:capsid portal protein
MLTATLTIKQPTFVYVNTCKKKPPLEIHFIYLGNKEIYCILRHAV